MASNDDNPELVDLLYDDELDDETAARLRSKIEESPEERAELESYEQLLSRIREEEPTEDVPGDVHDSIMAAAEERADRGNGSTEPDSAPPERPRTERRAPETSSGRPGIWARLSGTISTRKLALTAMALLAGGSTLYLLRAELTETPHRETQAAPTTSKSAEQPSSPAESPDLANESATDPTPGSKFGPTAPAPTDEGSDDSVAEVNEPDSPKGGGFDDSEGAEKDPGKKRAGPAKRPTLRPDDDETDKNDRRPAAESADSKKVEDLGESPSGFDSARSGGDESAGPGVPAESTGSDDRARSAEAGESSGDNRVADSEHSGGSGGDNLEDGAPLALDDSEASQNGAGRSGSSGGSDPAGLQKTAPEREAAAPEQVAPDDEGTEARAKRREPDASGEDPPTIEDVRSAYENGDWRQTIRRASTLLRSGSVDAEEKPKLLEWKARALERRSEFREAQRTYQTLRETYPDYKSSSIRAAAERMAREHRRAEKADEENAQERSGEKSASPPRPDDAPAESGSEEPAKIEGY